MLDSTRRHLDDVLTEYGAKVALYLDRREKIKSMMYSGGDAPRVQGTPSMYEGERYAAALEQDRVLAGLYRFIKPISDAIGKLEYHQRRLIELRYLVGMEQADIMKEMDMNMTQYYREKRKAMDALGVQIFGMYA